MAVAHSGFDRRIFKFATAILLLCMTFRHAMFYLDFGRINTEMGFDQSLFGVFLIPVTASFGCIFFWERSRISLRRNDVIRLLLIALLPVMLAYRVHDIQSLFTYPIDAMAKRPSFFILLPIVISVLLSWIFLLRLLSLLPIFLVNYLLGDIFLVHYITIFLTFAVLQTVPMIRKLQKSFASLVIYTGCVSIVVFFEIKRIGFILELLLAGGFVGAIFYLSSLISKLAAKIAENRFIDQLSVFYFYLFQALAFTAISSLIGKGAAYAFIPLVFISSILSAYYFRKLEEKAITTLQQ